MGTALASTLASHDPLLLLLCSWLGSILGGTAAKHASPVGDISFLGKLVCGGMVQTWQDEAGEGDDSLDTTTTITMRLSHALSPIVFAFFAVFWLPRLDAPPSLALLWSTSSSSTSSKLLLYNLDCPLWPCCSSELDLSSLLLCSQCLLLSTAATLSDEVLLYYRFSLSHRYLV